MALVNHVVESLGVPKDVLLPQAQVDQQRQQRAAAQQAEAMQRQQDTGGRLYGCTGRTSSEDGK